MAVITIFRLSEECLRIISGGNPTVGSKVTMPELKIACGQVANSLLKIDYFQTNQRTREMIPNGTVLGLYENIPVAKYKNKSQAILPIKPLKLPRNMGIFSIFDPENPDYEYIPLQMGQAGLLQSQPLLNDLMGQVGYSNFGLQILFTRDITGPDPSNPVTVSMRLAIMDITQYSDYEPLPILPEMEWGIKSEVCKMYGATFPSDKVVDTVKEQKGIPIQQQSQP